MKIFVYAEYNELRTEQFIVRQKNIVEHERNQSSNLYHFFFFFILYVQLQLEIFVTTGRNIILEL